MARALFGIAILSMIALGCGDGGSGSSTSSVSQSKKLSELTATDLKSICSAHEAQLNDLANTCSAVGIGASSKAECQSLVDDCNKGGSMPKTDSIDCAGANTSDLAGCSATVGDFESCLNSLASYFRGLTCADYAKPPTPPACFQSIQAKCPKLFGSADSSSSSGSGSAGSSAK